MAGRIVRIDCGHSLLSHPKVAALTFGTAPWEQYISDWLHTRNPDPTDSATAILDRGGRVWIWAEEDTGNVVGVSSFSECWVSDWPKKKQKIQASLLPVLGVDVRYRRHGYGSIIMNDGLAEAVSRAATRPAVVLYVDEQNPARQWYIDKFNFVPIGKPYVTDGRPHTRLVVAVNRAAT